MAEFYYFCTKNEFVGLLHASLIDGYVVHVNKHLAVPISTICTTVEEINSAIDDGQQAFFLARPDITRYPVELISVEREDGSLFWYPRSREGGPVIEAYFWSPYEKNGRRIAPCSLLTYHAKIINPDSGQFEPSGVAIKQAFGELVTSLRKRSRQVKAATRSAFVSPGMDAMLASGWVLAPPFEANAGT